MRKRDPQKKRHYYKTSWTQEKCIDNAGGVLSSETLMLPKTGAREGKASFCVPVISFGQNFGKTRSYSFFRPFPCMTEMPWLRVTHLVREWQVMLTLFNLVTPSGQLPRVRGTLFQSKLLHIRSFSVAANGTRSNMPLDSLRAFCPFGGTCCPAGFFVDRIGPRMSTNHGFISPSGTSVIVEQNDH